MSQALDNAALEQIFLKARTVHAFKPEPVSDETLHKLYDLLKWGPTAFNAQPARFVFIKSAEARARLIPALSPGNVAQVNSAPVTVIVAMTASSSSTCRPSSRSTTPSPCSWAMPPWPKPRPCATAACRAPT